MVNRVWVSPCLSLERSPTTCLSSAQGFHPPCLLKYSNMKFGRQIRLPYGSLGLFKSNMAPRILIRNLSINVIVNVCHYLSANLFSLFSSSILEIRSFMVRNLVSRSKLKGSRTMSARRRDRERATYEHPAASSLVPISTTTLGSVNPWDLWIVTAHANVIGNWILEQLTSPDIQVLVTPAMGTEPPIVGPV